MLLQIPLDIAWAKKSSRLTETKKACRNIPDIDFSPDRLYSLMLPCLIKRALTAAVFYSAILSCCYPGRVSATSTLDGFPPVILWAWERPEDLRFLDSRRVGVAFLAQTLRLSGDKVIFVPRMQPLKLPPATRLIAVTRIETLKNPSQPLALSDAQSNQLILRVLQTLALKNVAAIQLDFDAKVSERAFYRRLLTALRQRLPGSIPLSITALASFCIGDGWINDLPVDEAVPMIFRMGEDSRRVRRFLKSGGDFPVPLCRHSYGIATDEPLPGNFAKLRRTYIFKGDSASWTAQDIKNLTAVPARGPATSQ